MGQHRDDGEARSDDPQRDNMRYVSSAEGKLKFGELSADELRVLATINQKIAAAPSIGALLEYLFEASRDIFACDRLAIAFIEDGGRLVAHTAVASYEPLLLTSGYSEDIDDSSLARVLNEGRPRIINDLEAYLAERPESRSTQILLKEGVRSSMTCPLSLDGHVIGVLFRSSRTANCYSERDVRKHQAIAERLSQAVEKTYRLHQLQEANRAFTELMSFVTRGVKGPLTSMLLDAEKVLDGDLGELGDEQRLRLEDLQHKGEELLEQLKDFHDLALLESDSLPLAVDQHVDVQTQIVESALQLVRPQIDGRGMSVELHLPEEDLIGECDPELLRLATTNLLTNAVKYGVGGGHIRLGIERCDSISASSSCGETLEDELVQGFKIVVWNEGPGFDANEQGRLFRRFSRLKAKELRRQRSTGLGLYICWRVVRMHGGRIEASSERGSWAEFSIKIPQPLPAAHHDLATAANG
jgi:signal transduction histidine kinase